MSTNGLTILTRCTARHFSSLTRRTKQKEACVRFVSNRQLGNQSLNLSKILLVPHNERLLLINEKKYYSSTIPKPYVDSKYSYAYGRSSTQLEYTTISRSLEERIKANPDHVAIICHQEKKQVTYKQLERDINRVAKAMIVKFGIKRGDSVGIYAFNCYNWLVVQFACSKVGAILTPINPAYKAYELSYVLDKSEVRLLFAPGPKSVQKELNDHMAVIQSNEIAELCKQKKLPLENVVLIDEESSSDGYNVPNVKVHSWNSLDNDAVIYGSHEEAEKSNSANAIWIDDQYVKPDDLFAVYYTSGTTGRPKGACVSHFTAVNNAKFCQHRYEFKKGEPRIVVTPLPLFHIFAGVLTNLCILLEDATVVWTGHKYDMKVIIEAIKEHKCKLLTCTPTILIDLLSHVSRDKIQLPLKYIQSGGASLLPEVFERTFQILPNLSELRSGYGSTENGAVAATQSAHEPIDHKPISVGPPIDFSEIRIVQPNTEQAVPLGHQGEIQTRGFNQMVGYLKDEAKTNAVITDRRWYKTGDVGYLLPHGSLVITGRLKEMIIKGGENIYPKEVEQLILRLDWVEQVHVFGIPDKRFGEQVCAWVKVKPGIGVAKKQGESKNSYHADDIIDHCKKNITYFKVPKYVRIVDSFPMTATKKAQHHTMAEETINQLKSEGKYEG